MELFKGKRFWPTLTRERSFGKLTGEVNTEYVVIGGGMSGVLAAYHLARSGFSVVLVEQNRIAQGSTSLNTGLIQYMSDKTLSELTQDFGPDVAVSFYQASLEALDRIEKAAEDLPDEVSFRRNSSLYVTDDHRETEKIKSEAEAQQKAGFETVYLDSEEALNEFGIQAAAAMITRNDVELNPMAFVLGLAEKATQDFGLQISEETRIMESDLDLNDNIIRTDDLTVSFKRLILATGYEFFELASRVMPRAKRITTFAAVTEPLKEIPARGYMFWENSQAYGYFRKSPDHRLIIGGGDEDDEVLDEKKAEEMSRILCEDISEYLEDATSLIPEFYYEAIFGKSEDGLPYIGPHPEYEQVFLIHGVGGNGTVYSSIAAGEVLQWAEQGSHPLRYLWPGPKRIL